MHNNYDSLRTNDIDAESTATRGEATELGCRIGTTDRPKPPVLQQFVRNVPGLRAKFGDKIALSGADGYRKVDTAIISAGGEEIITKYYGDIFFAHRAIQIHDNVKERFVQICSYGRLIQGRFRVIDEDIAGVLMQDASTDT